MYVRDPGKTFDDKVVPADVSFEVGHGEVPGFRGPNGAYADLALESSRPEVNGTGAPMPRPTDLPYRPASVSLTRPGRCLDRLATVPRRAIP